MILNNHISIGGLLLFMNYAGRLLSPIDTISRSYIQYQQARISIKRILDFTGKSNKEYYSGIKTNNFNGNMEFKHVSFAYNEDKVLNDINLTAQRGKLINIVGTSGSGKSTIINLIMRFWNITDGIITIDGVNIKEYKLSFLRSKVAVVSQDIVLFNDTIYNNLVFNNKIDMDKVEECAIKSGVHSFIMKLPNKYNSVIGEKGATLSGGQRQKLALTRALLLDCPILIFDEVTASFFLALLNYNQTRLKEELK